MSKQLTTSLTKTEEIVKLLERLLADQEGSEICIRRVQDL